MITLWLARRLDRLTTLCARLGTAAWGWHYAHEKRVVRRAAIARVIAGSRGPSALIPASDRVDPMVGAPFHRDR